MLSRRRFVQTLAVAALSPRPSTATAATPPGVVINDVSRLNPIRVSEERRPRSTEEVQAALRLWPGPVSVGGGRFSMGGQIAAPRSMHLDMRRMNAVVAFDASKRTIRVQAGARWRDIQDVVDPYDLAVKTMQSYSNFTVGGSVSVNCHGRYVGHGPLINSVRGVQLVTATSEVLELTRSQHPELFHAVFGGYGGLGVVTEVELELDDNSRLERVVQDVPLEAYPAFFAERVLSDPRVIFHNADLTPPAFGAPRSISWMTTDKPLTEPQRLTPRNLDYTLEKNAIWAVTELPGGNRLRETLADRRLGKRAVVWRNFEASLDTASLEPRTRAISTYLLQEYFIPAERFLPFARDMARILSLRGVNALNVSIRHSPADSETLLTWAPTAVFSFVLYYKQRTSDRASAVTRVWTRELIEAALHHGGRYYLPYRLDATTEQFVRAYPEARTFMTLKARIDPDRRFRNRLWDKYLLPPGIGRSL
jgi:FAD/FMN-containing dehydrogenase